MNAFDTIPDHLFSLTPTHQSFHSRRYIPQFARDFGVIMHRWINIKRSYVASFNILRIIFRMPATRSPTIPSIPCNTLPKIQHHGTRGVRRFDALIILLDFFRAHWWSPTMASSQRLCIVGFIAMHPGNNRIILKMAEGYLVLFANQPKPRPL